MFALVKAFFEITIHERGPEHVPASWFLFYVVLASDLMISLCTMFVTSTMSIQGITLIGLSAVLTGAFIWMVLSFAGKQARFLQTATAFFGVDAILTVIATPILLWLGPGTGNDLPIVPSVLFVVVFIWAIDVFAFILSRSLGISYVLALLLVVAYQYITFLMRDVLMPVTP